MNSSQVAQSAYFSLHPRLQKAIVNDLGWRQLRPVQEASIPPLLAGNDAVILAPTAGGKTESALFPLLSRVLTEDVKQGPAILYLCPLKALINNLLPRLHSLAQLIGREAFAWHGEVGQSQRQAFLKEPKTILLITPESLQVLLTRPSLDLEQLLGSVISVVIDEVHAFCGECRGDQLSALLTQVDYWRGRPVQRVGLSATVGNPQDLLSWLSGARGLVGNLVDPGETQKKARLLEVLPVGKEIDSCARVLAGRMSSSAKSLLFVDSRRQAELARAHLEPLGIEAKAHHSSLSQELREVSETVFRGSSRGAKKAQAIVCTSTLELGLDVGDIDRVFQLGAPSTVSAFLQRFGRAGRRENSPAHMVFVTDRNHQFLQAVALINLAIKKQVEPVLATQRSFCVLVQQVLLAVLREGALAPDKLWTRLGNAAPFAGITVQEKKRLLDHLLQEEWLSCAQGRLHLADRTEKAYGRSHFLDLLSVFQSGQAIAVKGPGGRTLGTIDYGVAKGLISGQKSFLLGGRSWKAKSWNAKASTLSVVPSVGGEPLRWSGSKGELSFALMREMRELLVASVEPAFLGASAKKALAELRNSTIHLSNDAPTWTSHGKGEQQKLVVEQWAGERQHRTLGAILSGWLGTEFRYDARSWQIDETADRVWGFLREHQGTDWQELSTGGLTLYQGRHAPELSSQKFTELLPPEFTTEVLWSEHYDIDGAEHLWHELFRAQKKQPRNC